MSLKAEDYLIASAISFGVYWLMLRRKKAKSEPAMYGGFPFGQSTQHGTPGRGLIIGRVSNMDGG